MNEKLMKAILILIQINYLLNQSINSPFRERFKNIKTSVYKSLPKLLDKFFYEENELIPIIVDGIHSTKVPIPFSYEYLNQCNEKKKSKPKEGISDLLKGSQLSFSNYMVYMNRNETCVQSCEKEFDEKDIKLYQWLIKRNYLQRFYLDKLPSGFMYNLLIKENNTIVSKTDHFKGIPIGLIKDGNYYVYNHFKIYIHINQKENTTKFQIVEFAIKPFTINQTFIKNCSLVENITNNINEIKNEAIYSQQLKVGKIKYTYDITFIKSNQTFSTRFDHHFTMNKNLHWYGLILSNVILVIFTILILCVLTKLINSDFYEYERILKEGEIDSIQTYGWKDINGDVFRQPKRLHLLSALIGTGIEFMVILLFSLIFTIFGFITPEKRGSYLNYILYSFFGFGIVSGYVSTFVYKNFKGKEWLKNALITSFIFPFTISLILFLIKIIFLFEKSEISFNIKQYIEFYFLWIFIHTPLVLIGCILNIYRKKLRMPCKVNIIQRTINPKPWYLHIKYIVFFTGLFPFLTLIIEFRYLLSYMWVYQVYYMASFLALNIYNEVILSAEISIIYIFINLCKGDYNWWWKSFFVSASPSIYIFGYSIYYYFISLRIKRFSGILIYFIIMGSFSCLFGIVSGACGSLLTFYFVYFLYSKIRSN